MMYKIDKKHLDGVEKVLYLDILRKIVDLNMTAPQCIVPLADLLVTSALISNIPKKDFLVFVSNLYTAIGNAGELNSPMGISGLINSKGSKDAN